MDQNVHKTKSINIKRLKYNIITDKKVCHLKTNYEAEKKIHFIKFSFCF